MSRYSGETLAVAMSGGVDSSVAAYLLQRQGFSVCGVFISIASPAHVPCSSAADRQDAMRACAALEIPFLEYDATSLYEERVIKPLVRAYREGKTPNPDVLCNIHIKFGAFFSFLSRKGFSRVATGHYARVRTVGGHARLYRAADADKDQTYFLHALSRDLLASVLFPLGDLTKQEVRAIAARASLPSAGRPDSVGLCFLGPITLRDFLSAYIPPRTGPVRLLRDGRIVGTHDGSWLYTVGQRHGFTVTDSGGPYIVARNDVASNTLFVTPRSDARVAAGTVRLVDTVFRRVPRCRLLARCRHRGDLIPATLAFSEKDSSCSVTLERPQTIAAGQSVVLYTGDGECLGGGVVA